MSDQSATPRTDAFEEAHTQFENEVFIGYQAEFCRAIELEASDLRERLAKAETDARRWQKARQIFAVEDIERADREMRETGSVATEQENVKADAAIDAAIENEKGDSHE